MTTFSGKSNDTAPLLSVRHLKTFFSVNDHYVPAVDDISFDIKHGERVGLAGESGSGKTQTAMSIMGLVQGTPGIVQGEIWFKQQNMLAHLENFASLSIKKGRLSIDKDFAGWQKHHQSRMKRLRGRSISMIFQEPKSSLSPYFTVKEQLQETYNVLFKTRTYGFSDRINELLQELRFSDPQAILNAYPHHLSGGESQRVMLALSLMAKPELLIADEPTTLLDAVTQAAVIDSLQKMLQDTEIGLLFITHDLALMSHLVDRIIVMFAGKIVEIGQTRNMFEHADLDHHHPYTKCLIQAIRKADLKKQILSPQEENRKNYQGCRFFYQCPLKNDLSAEEQTICEQSDPPLQRTRIDHWIACWKKR